MTLNVSANRGTRKYSRMEQVKRVLWSAVWPLFALSPRPLWGFRRVLLRTFGAEVGRDACVYPSARITMPWNLTLGNESAVGDRAILYALGPIVLGPRATVSQGAHLCAGTHDINDPARPLLKPAIFVGADSWICADAFIGPGVTVGHGSIVGARAVAMKDVPAQAIVGGNPAKLLRKIDA